MAVAVAEDSTVRLTTWRIVPNLRTSFFILLYIRMRASCRILYSSSATNIHNYNYNPDDSRLYIKCLMRCGRIDALALANYNRTVCCRAQAHSLVHILYIVVMLCLFYCIHTGGATRISRLVRIFIRLMRVLKCIPVNLSCYKRYFCDWLRTR